jgi:hypothetical protein
MREQRRPLVSVPERPRRAVGETVLLWRRQGGLWRRHDDRARLGQVVSPSTGSARRPSRSPCSSRGFGRRLVGIAPAGLAIAAAFALAGHTTRATASPAGRVTLRGTVLDEHGKPIEDANVYLCTEGERKGVVFGGVGRCIAEIASTSAGRSGGFRLRLSHDVVSLPTRLLVDRSGYLMQTIPVAAIPVGTSPRPFEIALRPAPSVHGIVVDAEGKPVSQPFLGYLVEEAEIITTDYTSSPSPPAHDDLSLLGDVPEGKVMLFATTSGVNPQFATQVVETHSGSRSSLTLKADHPLQRLRGKVVDAGGLPIAARVSVEPTEPGGFTALDRVLLQARGNDTDPAGNFEFLITSPAKVVLRLSTWFGMGPSQTDHVREISLATVPAQFGLGGEPIVVKAPKSPVVRCTITGPPDARPEIDELGISFVPHDAPTGRKGQYFGHSGSCAMVGGHSGDPSRATPREVAFLWPGGTEALCIEARPAPGTLPPWSNGQPRSLLGIIMTRATDPCQIPVKPLEPQK